MQQALLERIASVRGPGVEVFDVLYFTAPAPADGVCRPTGQETQQEQPCKDQQGLFGNRASIRNASSPVVATIMESRAPKENMPRAYMDTLT